ncbi:hypothetical protein GIB67_023676 [Kingdonia uniflora]|uniref:B box-type domain-containing protein n=1 Tax=Kingdonia uniflora TaxID=39325 RepID=A0A7J7MG52_9MAGN|nr:hypothetical protein GIB67_023676 [Kingdonia uniflora]
MVRKDCELCDLPATMYCKSDEASLCWSCDSKVHSANFLVARHSRNLLCNVCQSPTPWNASGRKLGPTKSICENCVRNCEGREERNDLSLEEGYGGNYDNDLENSSSSCCGVLLKRKREDDSKNNCSCDNEEEVTMITNEEEVASLGSKRKRMLTFL